MQPPNEKRFISSVTLQLRKSLITLRLKTNGWHFADDIFEYIFLQEKFLHFEKNKLKFVSKRLIDNRSALVQVMAWHQTGAKPLPEPMLTQFNDAYLCQQAWMCYMEFRYCIVTCFLSLVNVTLLRISFFWCFILPRKKYSLNNCFDKTMKLKREL